MSPPVPMRQQVLRGRDVLATIGAAILLYVVGLLMARVVLSASSGPHANSQFLAIVLFAVVAYAMLGAIYLVLVRLRGFAWSDIGFAPCDPLWLRRALVLAALLIPAIFIAAYLLRAVLPIDPAADLSRHLTPRDFSWLAGVTVLLYAGLLIPVTEEMMFRGVIFRWLRTHLSWGAAAALSSAGFAILHQQMDAIIVAFGVGMVLAWLYEKSGSLLPSILLHQTVNSVQIALAYLFVATRNGA